MKTQEQLNEESLKINQASLVRRAGKSVIFSIIDGIVMGIHILDSDMSKEEFDALTKSEVITKYPVNAKRSATVWDVIKLQIEVVSEKTLEENQGQEECEEQEKTTIDKIKGKMKSLYSSTSWTSPDGRVTKNYKLESIPNVEIVNEDTVITMPFCQLRDKKHVWQRENIISEVKDIIKSLGLTVASERCEILGKIDRPVYARLDNRDNVQYVIVLG